MITGKRLNGRYKIIEMVGGGGMANVYLARDMILDRDVAVKVLRPDFSNDDEFIKRFHREANSTLSLDHPNIVSIYDVGEEDNVYFIVMEYIHGKTLKQYIQHNGPVSMEETTRIMSQLTSAIDHAHQNQIVHRDIKPHNILIDEMGNVKVTDFGIAMALSATSITQTNSVLGSVHYISPEQARGGMANRKSDIYSLGIVMFELITGRLPFSGESAVSIALKHLQTETPSPKRWNPITPQSIENIILKATAKDPFYRYETVEEMKNDLETALNEDRIDEPKFIVPEDDEKTKAIPIIADDFKMKNEGDTIVHSPNNTGKGKEVENPPKKKRKKLVPAIVGFLLFMILTTVVVYALPSVLKQDSIIIPDLSGQEIREAVSELQALGLKTSTEKRNDPDIPEGYVIKTDPEAETTVKAGFEVVIYESIGKEQIDFENYQGMQLEEATRELIAKGVPEENIKAYPKDSDQPENEIIAQLQPKPGEKVSPDDYENINIFFEISKGPNIKMPNMLGWNENEVNSFIKENELNVDYEDEVSSDEYGIGEVAQQSPEEGEELEKGDKIKVYLSKGGDPKAYTVSHVVPFDSDQGDEDQRVDVFIGDENHDINETYETIWIAETQEISFDVIVPYNGKASYKIYHNGEFFVSDIIEYESLLND